MSEDRPGGGAYDPGRRKELGLGELETAVLEVLWQISVPLTVREVHTALAPRRLAYTTVQTVLTKLHRKGWARRHLDHRRSYRYTATASRSETAARVLHSLLSAAEDVDAALLHFVGFVSSRERDVLRAALTDDTGCR